MLKGLLTNVGAVASVSVRWPISAKTFYSEDGLYGVVNMFVGGGFSSVVSE